MTNKCILNLHKVYNNEYINILICMKYLCIYKHHYHISFYIFPMCSANWLSLAHAFGSWSWDKPFFETRCPKLSPDITSTAATLHHTPHFACWTNVISSFHTLSRFSYDPLTTIIAVSLLKTCIKPRHTSIWVLVFLREVKQTCCHFTCAWDWTQSGNACSELPRCGSWSTVSPPSSFILPCHHCVCL